MVLRHPVLVGVSAFAAATLYVHFRGRVRYPFWRQITNYSTFLAPYSALMYLFSKVPTRPILDESHFPELEPLRANWKTIRDEALQLVARGEIRASEQREDIAFNSFFKRDWKRFYVKWYADVLPSARALCPKTVELVESIPSVNAAMFTLLSAHSRLPKHRDPFAGSLRYHLGLSTPNSDACRIEIDGITRSWRDGEVLIFDETYIHKVDNTTDQDRIILFCDIARPLRTPIVRGLNAFVTRHIVKITSSRNDGRERIGVVNRLSGRLYVLRDWTKRLKRANRPLYFTLAYGLKAAFLAIVLYGVYTAVR